MIMSDLCTLSSYTRNRRCNRYVDAQTEEFGRRQSGLVIWDKTLNSF